MTSENRISKILETANIKLGSVASDVLGASGRAMLRALIAGERDAQVLAGLAKGTLRKKIDQLVPSLTGRFLERHAFLLRQMLDHVEFSSRKTFPTKTSAPSTSEEPIPKRSNATSSRNWKPSAIESSWRKKPPRDDKTF